MGKVIAKFLSGQQYTDCRHINTTDFTVNKKTAKALKDIWNLVEESEQGL
jgi:hypothetical protein